MARLKAFGSELKEYPDAIPGERMVMTRFLRRKRKSSGKVFSDQSQSSIPQSFGTSINEFFSFKIRKSNYLWVKMFNLFRIHFL